MQYGEFNGRVGNSPNEDENLQGIVNRMEGKKYDVFADAPSTYGSDARSEGLDCLGLEGESGTRQVKMAKELTAWLKTVL